MTRTLGWWLAAVVAALVLAPVPDHGTDDTLPVPASAIADGHAATWPCAPIRYAVNADQAPAGGTDDLAAALADLSAATGYTFIPAGPTTDIPARAGRPDRRRGDRAAPLVIAWAHRPGTTGDGATESALLTGAEVAGKTRTVTSYRPRHGVFAPQHNIVSADVVIDAELTADPRTGQGWGGQSGQRAFLVHELMHALGLGHTDRTGSVLHPALPPGPYAVLDPGDVTALTALLASRRC